MLVLTMRPNINLCVPLPPGHESLTRVARSYLLALGTTQISSYFTKHWTKFLTHILVQGITPWQVHLPQNPQYGEPKCLHFFGPRVRGNSFAARRYYLGLSIGVALCCVPSGMYCVLFWRVLCRALMCTWYVISYSYQRDFLIFVVLFFLGEPQWHLCGLSELPLEQRRILLLCFVSSVLFLWAFLCTLHMYEEHVCRLVVEHLHKSTASTARHGAFSPAQSSKASTCWSESECACKKTELARFSISSIIQLAVFWKRTKKRNLPGLQENITTFS